MALMPFRSWWYSGTKCTSPAHTHPFQCPSTPHRAYMQPLGALELSGGVASDGRGGDPMACLSAASMVVRPVASQVLLAGLQHPCADLQRVHESLVKVGLTAGGADAWVKGLGNAFNYHTQVRVTLSDHSELAPLPSPYLVLSLTRYDWLA